MVPPLLWRASCALAICLSACSDYDLNKVAEDPEDTGGPPELPTVDIEICREPPAASEIASPGLGWTDSSVCHAYSAPTYGAIGVRTLTSFSVAGLETSPTPPSNVRLVAQDNIDGSFGYPNEANIMSDRFLDQFGYSRFVKASSDVYKGCPKAAPIKSELVESPRSFPLPPFALPRFR
jgi:hypothetical protein